MRSDETGRPRVFLGMPRYGPVEMGAARAFFSPSCGATLDVIVLPDAANSLTPNAFNALLAIALDMRDKGAVTHFAMIHSDVEPEGYWLDTLYDQMVETKADLVSAVIPIKEDLADPFTSTAIGDAENVWAIKRRFRLSDRKRLPVTFGQADVCEAGEVLLVNTGLWLADLRHPAWDAFSGFDIHCRIQKLEDGRRNAQCRPEDWEMSRHLHRHGAKVMATWKVGVEHRGSAAWKNW